MGAGGGVLEQALWFARFGVPVVPCFTPCRCTIRAAVHCDCHRAHGKLGPDCADPEHSIGKHPRTQHGLSDATTDVEQIEKWWGLWPKANLAIRTGADAGLWGLDVDPRHGGDESLLALEFEHGPLPETATVRTGSGGRHILFLHPGGTIPNSSAKVGDGLDVRGDGGYLVAPTSEHVSGTRYEWLTPLAATPLASAPDWLLTLMGVQQGTGRATWGNSAPAGDSTADDPIPSGRRHQTLASFAGAMRRKGFSAPAILAALRAENDARCVPPLDDGEVERIAADIAKKPPAAAEPVLIRVVRGEEPKREPPKRIPDVPDVCWRGWFAEYRDVMGPTTEAPDVYHLGAAFVMAGAVLKRRVWVDYAGVVYPNVYCILVGASGRNRKDTAIKRALSLLDAPDLRAPLVSKLNMVSSAEGLIERMAQGRSVVLHPYEMSILLRNAKREGTSSIIPWLTNIFDCPDTLELAVRKNPVTAHNPFLCILGGTTPDWFDSDVDEDMIRGGFLGRFLYLNGEPKPSIDLPPKPDPVALRWLRERLHGLADGFDRTGGREYELSDAARSWWHAWYAQESGRRYFGDLDVLFQRVHLYVMKIALLYATLEQADEIEPEHLEAAAAFVRLSQAHVEASHPRWGASLDSKLTNKILDYLAQKGGHATRRELHLHLSGRVTAPVFGNVLRTMAAFQRISLPDEKTVALPDDRPPTEATHDAG